MKKINILKLINVKYKSTFDKDGISILNGSYPEYNFVPSTNTKLIAGYTCHEGIIEFPGKELPDFSVFYTTHLKITNPNIIIHNTTYTSMLLFIIQR